MSFYLKPPRGDISLEKLEDLVLKRWRFLQILNGGKNEDELQERLSQEANLSESVMENSSKDRVSHFFLGLAIAQSQSYTLKELFLESESKLFKWRLDQACKKDINQSLCDVVRHIDNLNHEDTTLSILSESIVTILRQNMLENSSENDGFTFQVPFYVIPSLVAKRHVQLSLGQAQITCSIVPEFLSGVFSKLLANSLRKFKDGGLQYGFEEDDQRILNLLERIHLHIKDTMSTETIRIGTETLKAKDVDKEASSHFPACFKQVHAKLKLDNRLGHHARIAYTLFLKDLGMPLEESVKFWQHFYSKTCLHDCKCSHSWQDNDKRYIYSIHHLYGQAGGGKNYSAHGCKAIADRASSINEELTCPFSSDRSNNLDIEDLLDPRKKCLNHLASSQANLPNLKPIAISKPSHFYFYSKQSKM